MWRATSEADVWKRKFKDKNNEVRLLRAALERAANILYHEYGDEGAAADAVYALKPSIK